MSTPRNHIGNISPEYSIFRLGLRTSQLHVDRCDLLNSFFLFVIIAFRGWEMHMILGPVSHRCCCTHIISTISIWQILFKLYRHIVVVNF